MLEATLTLITDLVKQSAHPLTCSAGDYDPLLELIGNARFVLLGEASHGTHEFYRERAQITKRLISEKCFNVIAVEADWPDAGRVNSYVQGQNADADAVEALAGFQRFPAWMWRNADVLDFVGWLRTHNESLSPGATTAGFYGLDLYSLRASIEAVLNYLDKVDPAGAQRARHRYACFENFGEDPQAYGYAAGLGLSPTCESEVVAQLIDLQRRSSEYARRDGRMAEDDFFYAQQNARLIKSAESYYRSMFHGRVSSWNLRDEHMANTLDALVQHFALRNRETKVVVWAHNSH
jgi:erythromycin esterase-like protein